MKIVRFLSLYVRMTKEKKKFLPLTSNDICEIYSLLHSEGVISFPLSVDASNKIDSLVSSITGSNFGIENYPTDHKKAVAYLYFMIKNHPFTDGNKRTAVLVFLVLCDRNSLIKKLENYDLDSLAVFLERQDGDHQTIVSEVAKVIFNKK
jgi:prophage maintenance system killer protein